MNAQQLRNSILQMAIQGKLVPQDPNDEPASVLLERIRQQKEQLVKEGKLKKKDLVTTPVAEEEMPFEIPESWEWVHLGEIFAHNNGKQLNRADNQGEYHKYITTSNVYWDRFDLKEVRQMLFTEEELKRCTATKGDLLVCEGGDVGRSAIWNLDYDICIQNHIHRVRAYYPLCTRYFLYILMLNKSIGLIGGKGIGIQGFSATALHNTLVALPPLAEQRRIVAKLEELLPLVEQYGKVQDSLDALNTDLPRRLRQSILQQAIQGKLVPQDPNEGTADVVIDKSLYKGKISVLDVDEYPFEIPSNWRFFRLQDIATTIGGYAFKGEELKDNIGTRVIRISDVTPNGFSNKNIVRYNGTLSLEQYQIRCDDILIAMTGGTVGKSYLVPSLEEKLLLNQRVAIVRASKHILPQYLSLLIQSPLTQELINDRKNSTNDNISMVDIRSFPIPLPPLAEQRRIVAKIEELFTTIDKLK